MFRLRLERKNETVATTACHDLRKCEQCGNVITDPMVTRCPRCWGPLPAPICGSCRGCPVGKVG